MRTAILVDLENVVQPRSLRRSSKAGRVDKRFERVTAQLVETIQSFATGDEVIISETFGKASSFDGWNHLEKGGFNHTHVAGAGNYKNASDIAMVTRIITLLFEAEHIEKFVVVTGDSDITPVVRVLKEKGKRTVVIGNSSTPPGLKRIADEFVVLGTASSTTNPSTEVDGAQSQHKKQEVATGTVPAAAECDSADMPAATSTAPSATAPSSATAYSLLVRAWFLALPLEPVSDPYAEPRRTGSVWSELLKLAGPDSEPIKQKYGEMNDFLNRYKTNFIMDGETMSARHVDVLKERSDAPCVSDEKVAALMSVVAEHSTVQEYAVLTDSLHETILQILGPKPSAHYCLNERWNLSRLLNHYVTGIDVKKAQGKPLPRRYRLYARTHLQ